MLVQDFYFLYNEKRANKYLTSVFRDKKSLTGVLNNRCIRQGHYGHDLNNTSKIILGSDNETLN